MTNNEMREALEKLRAAGMVDSSIPGGMGVVTKACFDQLLADIPEGGEVSVKYQAINKDRVDNFKTDLYQILLSDKYWAPWKLRSSLAKDTLDEVVNRITDSALKRGVLADRQGKAGQNGDV